MNAPRCGHRAFGGIARDGGYVLRCKACGLVTTTVRPDLTTAAINKLVDFADATRDAEALRRAKAARR